MGALCANCHWNSHELHSSNTLIMWVNGTRNRDMTVQIWEHLLVVIAIRSDSFTDTNYFNNQKHFTAVVYVTDNYDISLLYLHVEFFLAYMCLVLLPCVFHVWLTLRMLSIVVGPHACCSSNVSCAIVIWVTVTVTSCRSWRLRACRGTHDTTTTTCGAVMHCNQKGMITWLMNLFTAVVYTNMSVLHSSGKSALFNTCFMHD